MVPKQPARIRSGSGYRFSAEIMARQIWSARLRFRFRRRALVGKGMTERRKVFRIEQTAADLLVDDDPQALRHAEIMRELRTLRAMLAAAPPSRVASSEALWHAENEPPMAELQVIHSGLSGIEPQYAGGNATRSPTVAAARVANELDAVMKGSEQATEKILAAAEDIDQAANNLSAGLKNEVEQELAQDIRDRVIQIFEACNFQDLTSQRIAKVMATLERIDQQNSGPLDRLAHVEAAPSVRGPRLESDRGHASQRDIDYLFDGGDQPK